MTAEMRKIKEEVELSINTVCCDIQEQTGECFGIPLDKDNALWAKASAMRFEDNEFLRQTICYKRSLLKLLQDRLTQLRKAKADS